MDDNDVDIQLDCPLGETTKETPYKPAAQHAFRQVEQKAASEKHPVGLRFGRTEPLFEDTRQTVTFRDLKKMTKCLAVVALLLLILFGAIHLASKTSSSDLTGTSDKKYLSFMITQEEDTCDYSAATPDINMDNEILALMAYDAPNVQDMFEKPIIPNDIDNRTCALYDVFQHLFKRLCSLKDDIIGTSPKASQSDTVSRINADIPKETSAINPRDELVVEESE